MIKTTNRKYSWLAFFLLIPVLLTLGLFSTNATESKESSKPIVHVNPFQQRFLNQVDTLINNNFERRKIPGAAVVIVKDTSVVYMRGLGVKEIGTTDSVHAETIFRLGSLSKGMTGLLSAILVADSIIAWDDTVSHFLPEFKTLPAQETDSITIMHLLSHSSGFPYHTYTNLIENGKSIAEILPWLKNVELIAEPGERYSYQNVLFSLIAEIIKKQSGKEFTHVLQEKLFMPLNMKQASASYEAISAAPNVALPHGRHDSSWVTRNISEKYYNAVPAGGINASILDMGQYIKALLGAYPEIINQRQLRELYSPQISTPIEWRYRRIWHGLKDMHYALGWRTMEFEQDTLIYHGGYVNNYRSSIALNPKDKWGICILSNAPGGFTARTMTAFWRLYKEHQKSINSWDRYIRKIISSRNAL